MPVQAEQLRQHYMTKYNSEVADAHQNLQPVLQNIKELKRKVRSPFISALKKIMADDNAKLNRIMNILYYCVILDWDVNIC